MHEVISMNDDLMLVNAMVHCFDIYITAPHVSDNSTSRKYVVTYNTLKCGCLCAEPVLTNSDLYRAPACPRPNFPDVCDRDGTFDANIVAFVDFNINGLPVGINTTKINVYYC